MGKYAWVTLATNDSYSLGALVLAHSLRRVDTKYELACLVTPGVTAMMREKLAAVFSLVKEVNVLDSKDEANLALLARPELGITFTKLHCWRLTQYEKCVFLDADTLVVRNCDELFEREELSAAPDVGWPDCFNSGVFVFRPSQETFASIIAFAAAKGSFDGGDQGLLNMYFSDWATKDISKHLPFIYNLCSTATYSYLPAFKQFGTDVRIIHFIGMSKPWLQYFDTLTGIVQPPPGCEHLQPLLQLWWNIFCDQVHRQLSGSMKRRSEKLYFTVDSHEANSPLVPMWQYSNPTTPLLYEPFAPATSAFSGTRHNVWENNVYLHAPDFSEFKDPWKNYRKYSYEANDTTLSERSENYGFSPSGILRRENEDMGRTPIEDVVKNSRQFQYEQQQQRDEQHAHDSTFHSGHTIWKQNYNQEYHLQHTEHHTQNLQPHKELIPHYEQHQQDQNQQHTTSHSGESSSHFVQHTEHHHWQQHNESTKNQHQYDQQHNQQIHHEQHWWHKHDDHENQHNQQQNEQPQHFEQPKQIFYHQYQAGDHHAQPVTNFVPSQSPHYFSENQSRPNEENQKDHQTSAGPNINEQYITGNIYVTSNESSFQAASNREHTSVGSPPSSSTPRIDFHNVPALIESHTTEKQNDAQGGIAGALAQMVLGEAKSAEQIALEDYMRKQSWELGQMDYMGRDSFDNVWKKICETLSRGPSSTDKPETKEERMDESAASPAAEMTDASVKTDEDETRMQSVVSKVPEEKLSTQEQPPICKLPEEKSPAQIITCEKSDADIQIAQSPEQKTPRVSAEESIKMKTVETKVSSEPVATETGEACAKLADEKPQDAKPGVETSSPKSPEESLLAEALAEKCTLASPPAPEAMSSDQSKSPLEMPSAQLPTKDSQLAESQISTCLLTSVCKLPAQEAAAVASRAAPTDKPQLPASVTLPDVTQPAATPPISTDSQQVTATSAIPASKAPIKDISKCATESAKDVTQPLTIDPSEQHAEMLLAASEISTISPVPIQVAESVLQAEPKESVSGAVASDQAIATTVTAVHESTEITAATTTEPEKSIIQLNGETEKRTTAVSSPPKEAAAVAEPMKETRSDLVMTKEMPSEAPAAVKEKTKSGRSVAPPEMSSEKAEKLVELAEPIAQMDPTAQRQKTEVKSPEQITKTAEAKLPEQPAKTETTEAKAPKQIAKLETEGKSPEQVAKTETTEMIAKPKPTAKAEITETKPTEPTEQVTKAEVAAAKSPETLESLAIERELPAESAEAKAQSIPSTPTVIEATPPTTPSVESAQEAESQEKAKKLKKSDSAEGTDGEDKKKKTVKKVTKKPKSKPEEVPSATTEATSTAAAVDSSQGKAKKTVKVTKKTGAKTLETDTAVPETPPPQPSATTSPPTTPDTPVPPKRKTKSSTTAKGTTGKKPDEE